ncbi:hypothetical protein Hanom_Chr09g00807301 [Helianthus anomalus]
MKLIDLITNINTHTLRNEIEFKNLQKEILKYNKFSRRPSAFIRVKNTMWITRNTFFSKTTHFNYSPLWSDSSHTILKQPNLSGPVLTLQLNY